MTRRTIFLGMKLITLSTLVALLGMLAGCSGGGGDDGSATLNTGTLKVSITDKQSDDFAQVVISIREIRVVPVGSENAADDDPGLTVVPLEQPLPRVIDVMQLKFVQQVLGQVVLPEGSYSQLRLILDPNVDGQPPVNYLTLDSDPATRIPLKTPSGQQSGLKLLGPIVVKAGVINAVMIDFDPETAIVKRGNGDYNLKPTGIRVVQTADMDQYGSIGGTVSATFKDWSSATVSVKRRGDINDEDPIAAGRIFSTYTSGRWQAPFAAFVPPSTTTVSYKTFIAANGFRVYSSPMVPVTVGHATELGDILLTPPAVNRRVTLCSRWW